MKQPTSSYNLKGINMKAKIKIKSNEFRTLYIGVLSFDTLTLSSREFDEYENAESWLTNRIKSEIDRTCPMELTHDPIK